MRHCVNLKLRYTFSVHCQFHVQNLKTQKATHFPYCYNYHEDRYNNTRLVDILPNQINILFTFHAPWKPGVECFLKVLLGHPATQLAGATLGDGHRVSLFLGNDDRLAFNPGHVPGVSESQPAATIKNTHSLGLERDVQLV